MKFDFEKNIIFTFNYVHDTEIKKNGISLNTATCPPRVPFPKKVVAKIKKVGCTDLMTREGFIPSIKLEGKSLVDSSPPTRG